MGLLDFFKHKKVKVIDNIKELTIAGLYTGCFVDFDMKTWKITGYNYYDWGSDDLTYEWQLESANEIVYLEREPDDEDYLSITRKIAIKSLEPTIVDSFSAGEDPPNRIIYNQKTYTLEGTGGGHFHKDGKGFGKELIRWDYADETGLNLLSIEQWGENDFDASAGSRVEEYQFTNILPGKK